MVRVIWSILLVSTILGAAENAYTKSCLGCHDKLSFEMQDIFFRYLLKYSGEQSVKTALVDFLKHPNAVTSVMDKTYIRSFGVKQKTTLDEETLQLAVDIFWSKYTVFGKIE